MLLTGQVNPGWGADNFWLGFPRVFAEFSFGVVLYTERHRVPELPVIVPFALVLAVLACFLFGNGKLLLVNILILLPALILSGSKMKTESAIQKACAFLGDISYPLYIIHVPLNMLLFLGAPLSGLTTHMRTLCTAALALAVSAVLACCDRMLRRRLNHASWRDKVRAGVAG